jgi:hypothetical protein
LFGIKYHRVVLAVAVTASLRDTELCTETAVRQTPPCPQVESLMSARHGAEKVLRCWGSGA